MNCKKCGQIVQPFDKFCSKCGNRTDESNLFTNAHSQSDQYYENRPQGQYTQSVPNVQPRFYTQNGVQHEYIGAGEILNKAFSSGFYIISCILMSAAIVLNVIGFNESRFAIQWNIEMVLDVEFYGLTAILAGIVPAIGCGAMWCLLSAAYNRSISNNTTSIKVIDVVQKIQWYSLWAISALLLTVTIILAVVEDSSDVDSYSIVVLLCVPLLAVPPVMSAASVVSLVWVIIKPITADLAEKTSKEREALTINHTSKLCMILLVIAATALAVVGIWLFINYGVTSVKRALAKDEQSINGSFGVFVACLILGCTHLLAVLAYTTTDGMKDLTTLELASQFCYSGAMITLGVTFLQIKKLQQQNDTPQYM